MAGTESAGDRRDKALRYIERCADPLKLEKLIANAREQDEPEVERAARLKLYEVKPAAREGTLEHDVWRSIYALEDTLSSEREKTTLLNRTRPKIAREGETAAVADLVLKKQASPGFHMLVERDMASLTFESLALRHPNRFAPDVLAAAADRLRGAGIDPETASRGERERGPDT